MRWICELQARRTPLGEIEMICPWSSFVRQFVAGVGSGLKRARFCGLVGLFRYLVKIFIRGLVGKVKNILTFGYARELSLDIRVGIAD